MSEMLPILPAGFEDLERFVPAWVFATERERNAFRVSQSQAALQDFYDAMIPRLEAIARRLDDAPLDALSLAEGRLLELALMAMEVAPAIEYYGTPDVPNSVEFEKFEILPVPVRYQIGDRAEERP